MKYNIKYTKDKEVIKLRKDVAQPISYKLDFKGCDEINEKISKISKIKKYV